METKGTWEFEFIIRKRKGDMAAGWDTMQIINLGIIACGTVIGFVLFWRFGMLGKNAPIKRESRTVSVVIPARNEEHNLANLLEDLKHQSVAPSQIICVNDASSDGTEAVIDAFGAVKINTEKLPKGWRGKTWACQKGAEKASGELVLFVDADVRLETDALQKLLDAYRPDAVVSVQPYHVTQKPYEKFSQFFNIIQVGGTRLCLPFGKVRDGLFGPVLLVDKKRFLKLGGYAPVKNTIAEDFALGRHYRKMRLDKRMYLGGKTVRFRMYPGGPGEMIQGWVKNFSRGAAATRPPMLAAIIVWITALTVLPAELIRAILMEQTKVIWGLILTYGLFAVQVYRGSRRIGNFGIFHAILYPITLIGFHVIFIHSFLASLGFKTSTWKGRKL